MKIRLPVVLLLFGIIFTLFGLVIDILRYSVGFLTANWFIFIGLILNTLALFNFPWSSKKE